MQGLFLEGKMDQLYSAGVQFEKLIKTEYRIILSAGMNKELERVCINFDPSDLYHMLGLQHLDDIELPNNRKTLLDKILSHEIDDAYLSKSKYYDNSIANYGISERMHTVANLESLMDSDNTLFYIYRMQHQNVTSIKADYLIVCIQEKNNPEIYIFVRKRKENDNYSIISCFQRSSISYWGGKRYLMLKEKSSRGCVCELYRNPNFTDKW